MLMPETAMYKDHGMVFWQNDVWFTWQTSYT